MGCSRVGARLADVLSTEGHDVTILDINAQSFRRLPQDFKGTALLASGMDETSLKKAGIEHTDVFIAVTQGDNRNIIASQIAATLYKVPKVICRIYDPLRRDLYSELGLETVSSTTIVAQTIRDKVLGQDKQCI